MKDILLEYELNLGQCVNFDKYTIFFSSNTSELTRLQISQVMDSHISTNSKKYLGLPSLIGRNKRLAF